MDSSLLKRLTALGEVVAFYGTIFAVIWLGQRLQWRPPLLIAGLALLGVCYWSNRRHGDSLERMGLAAGHLKPCARSVLKILWLPMLALAATALAHPLPAWPKIIFGVIGYPLWAFAQEYALLSFVANRLRDAFGPRDWTVAAVSGLLFAFVHFPNPVLMAASFLGGAVFTKIFLKTPHLVPIAVAHAWAGFLISVIFQARYNAMMIGPAFIKWMGVPGPPP